MWIQTRTIIGVDPVAVCISSVIVILYSLWLLYRCFTKYLLFSYSKQMQSWYYRPPVTSVKPHEFLYRYQPLIEWYLVVPSPRRRFSYSGHSKGRDSQKFHCPLIKVLFEIHPHICITILWRSLSLSIIQEKNGWT